eukprot:1853318-Rhodomonas_salina.3
MVLLTSALAGSASTSTNPAVSSGRTICCVSTGRGERERRQYGSVPKEIASYNVVVPGYDMAWWDRRQKAEFCTIAMPAAEWKSLANCLAYKPPAEWPT